MKKVLFILFATIMIASCTNSKVEHNPETDSVIIDSTVVDSTVVDSL